MFILFLLKKRKSLVKKYEKNWLSDKFISNAEKLLINAHEKVFFAIIMQLKNNQDLCNKYNINYKQKVITTLADVALQKHKIYSKAQNYIDSRLFKKHLINLSKEIEFNIEFYKKISGDNKEYYDKSIGALFGLATGDALGTTLEFEFPPEKLHTEIIGGGKFQLSEGEWTDDFSMAWCITKSLLRDGFNLKSQMDFYAKWSRFGELSSNGTCFDIGVTTSNAIKRYITLEDYIAGSKERHHAGNGSMMRLSPIPIYANSIEEAIHQSGESSKTTHGSSECIESCQLLGGMLFELINREFKSKKEFFDKFLLENADKFNFEEPKVKHLFDKSSWINLEYDDLPNSGYVIDTMISALWCFYHTDTFEDALIKVVNLAGDSDTMGAVCGQIAGAYYGYSNIPERWASKIKFKDKIIQDAYLLADNKKDK